MSNSQIATEPFFCSPDYLRRYHRPGRPHDLRHHRLVGYISEMLFSDALRYLEELAIPTPAGFAPTSMIVQREGAGLAILRRVMALDNLG